MQNVGVIYKIENLINANIYVGQTLTTFKRRKCQHISKLKNKNHKNPYLQNAWNKYGGDNFKFSIIEHCSIEDIDKQEIHWINFYAKNHKMYNIESGGNKNKKLSNATKIKLSRSSKELWLDKSYLKKQKENNMRKIICINTGILYGSIKEASQKLDVSQTSIYLACIGKQISIGAYKGKPIQVAYYKEGKNYKLQKTKKYNAPKKVICVNTKEIFKSTNEAAKKYNLQQSKISNCCNKKRQTTGILSNGERIIWRFLDEYDPNEKIIFSKKVISKGHKRKIICKTTGEIFESLISVSKNYSIGKCTVWRACTGRIKNVKLKNGKLLEFVYAE